MQNPYPDHRISAASTPRPETDYCQLPPVSLSIQPHPQMSRDEIRSPSRTPERHQCPSRCATSGSRRSLINQRDQNTSRTTRAASKSVNCVAGGDREVRDRALIRDCAAADLRLSPRRIVLEEATLGSGQTSPSLDGASRLFHTGVK